MEKNLLEKMQVFYNEFLPELQKELPKAVYKYIALGSNTEENNKRFLSLENNQVWFSNVNILNDPYEGRVSCYAPLFTTIKTDFFGDEQKIRSAWNRCVEEGRKMIQVCSFSEREDLMPLWAHYANNNQGYCVEYEMFDKHQLCRVFYTAYKRDISFDFEKLENEKTKWLQKCLSDVKKGRKGITIIVDSPFEKGKFYLTKERFINKIYECCIYKGYVSYDDIMNEDIG